MSSISGGTLNSQLRINPKVRNAVNPEVLAKVIQIPRGPRYVEGERVELGGDAREQSCSDSQDQVDQLSGFAQAIVRSYTNPADDTATFVVISRLPAGARKRRLPSTYAVLYLV